MARPRHPDGGGRRADRAPERRRPPDRARPGRHARSRAVPASRPHPDSNARNRSERRRRESSFLDATDHPVEIVHVANTAESGYEGMAQLLERAPDIDAVFAYNDVMALGAIRALREGGRTVPDDVAVIGVDGVEMGAHTTPSLTTVSIDRDRLGREAVRLIVALTRGEPVESPTTLDVELLVRDSA